MVECSPTLRKVQYDNLKCTDEAVNEEDHTKRTISMLSGAPISWHSTLEEVPSGCMVFLIHPFLFMLLSTHIFLFVKIQLTLIFVLFLLIHNPKEE